MRWTGGMGLADRDTLYASRNWEDGSVYGSLRGFIMKDVQRLLSACSRVSVDEPTLNLGTYYLVKVMHGL